MKKTVKQMVIASLAGLMLCGSTFTSYADEWVQDEKGWRYQLYDGDFMRTRLFDPKGYYIDSDKDGIAELYYFDRDGYMLTNTVGPSVYNFFTDETKPLYAVDEHGRAYDTITGKKEELALPQGTINTDILMKIIKPEYATTIMQGLDVVDANLGTTVDNRNIELVKYLNVYINNNAYTRVYLIDNKVTKITGNCQTLFMNPLISINEISSTLGVEPEVEANLLPDNPLYKWRLQRNPDVVLTLFNAAESDAAEQRKVGIYVNKTVD